MAIYYFYGLEFVFTVGYLFNFQIFGQCLICYILIVPFFVVFFQELV